MRRRKRENTFFLKRNVQRCNEKVLCCVNLRNEIFQVVPLKRMKCILCKRAQSPYSCFTVKFGEIIIIIPTSSAEFTALLLTNLKNTAECYVGAYKKAGQDKDKKRETISENTRN